MIMAIFNEKLRGRGSICVILKLAKKAGIA
jgi:hypothetical protein